MSNKRTIWFSGVLSISVEKCWTLTQEPDPGLPCAVHLPCLQVTSALVSEPLHRPCEHLEDPPGLMGCKDVATWWLGDDAWYVWLCWDITTYLRFQFFYIIWLHYDDKCHHMFTWWDGEDQRGTPDVFFFGDWQAGNEACSHRKLLCMVGLYPSDSIFFCAPFQDFSCI